MHYGKENTILLCLSNDCCCCLVTNSCPTLCDPTYCSPLGSSVHGISLARILQWVAISFSKGIFQTQGLNLWLLHW